MPSRLSRVEVIENELLSMIEKWPDAEIRLPSETEIAERFDVSRVTVREALASLARRGWVTRKHGLGTFVNQKIMGIQTRLDILMEISELIRLSGHTPTITLVSYRRGPTSPIIADRLEIKPEQETITIHKVFSADDVPAAYISNVIPLDLIPENQLESVLKGLDPELQIYEVLDRWFQQKVAYQVAEVDGRVADGYIAEFLSYPRGGPILQIEEVGYNAIDKPVIFCREYYRPGIIQFNLVRKPVKQG